MCNIKRNFMRRVAVKNEMIADTTQFQSTLCCAAASGHIDMVRSLIKDNAVTGQFIDDAFYYAASRGHIDLMRMLLREFGADVHTQNERPLSSAAQYGRIDVMCELLDQGADVHAQQDKALRSAAHVGGNEEAVRTLLAAGADVEVSGALDVALQGENKSIVHILLEHGARTTVHFPKLRKMLLVDIPEMPAFCIDEELVWAVDAGLHWSHRALALLRRGANVQTQDNKALRIASMDGNEAVVFELIRRGAEVRARDDESLRLAAQSGYSKEVVIALLNAGANVHARENEALRSAAKYHRSSIVNILLEHGADKNAIM